MPDPWLPLDRTNPEPHIDLLKIAFPTDNLTIKAIRQQFPEIDGDRLYDFDDIELPGMLSLERDLATAAFDAVLGRRTVDITVEDRRMLGKVYVRYGLASGPHHAKQLIRASKGRRRPSPRAPAGSSVPLILFHPTRRVSVERYAIDSTSRVSATFVAIGLSVA